MTTADEKMREEFESEVLKADGHIGKLPCKTYSDPITSSAWWGWQASAAQYSARLKELEQQVQFWAEHTPNDEFCRKYAELEQQLSIVGDELTELRKFETGAKTVIGELEQKNEQLQAQVAMLRAAVEQDAKTYNIPLTAKLCESLSATTQTAEAYKRRIQAEALEKAEDRILTRSRGECTCDQELRRMAAELKEGE